MEHIISSNISKIMEREKIPLNPYAARVPKPFFANIIDLTASRVSSLVSIVLFLLETKLGMTLLIKSGSKQELSEA